MTAQNTWKSTFANWPAAMAQRGILVTLLNESIPFRGFMIKDDLLLLERANPDSLGARFILIGFDGIGSVRFTDPIKESIFKSSGFTGKLSQ